MLSFFIGLLTIVLVLDCILLIFLVILQLPKKEAGAGMAFGGAASDALFGAGSGNVLTKITKYVAAIFFILALVLSIMNGYKKKSSRTELEAELARQRSKPAMVVPPLTTSSNSFSQPAVTPTNVPAVAPDKTAPNLLLTNAPSARAATNIPAK